MIHDHLLDELDKVAARYRHLRFWQLLAGAWLLAAVAGAAVWAARASVGLPPGLAVSLLCSVAIVLASIGIWLAATSARDHGWVAQRVESAFPELRTCLLAAVEQQPDLPGGRFGYLQASVIHQALSHAQRHAWQEVVPRRSIVLAGLMNLVAFSLFGLALLAVAFTVGPTAAGAAVALARGELASPGSGFSVAVEPGDTEIERGASLLILARVQGRMPAEATLVALSAAGETTQLPMAASLEDPLFGGRIPAVNEELTYHVELGGHATPSYRVTVFEYPRLDRADAQLVYPKYTGLEERLVQDIRTVSVVEGTELTLICRLNKPITTARLVDARTDAAAEPIALLPATEEHVYQATIRCEQSRRLLLELVDDAGRKNVKPAQFSIHVLPNQPPAIKPIFPARDLEVSALEEIDTAASVWDDFGLVRHGLVYALAGQEPVEVVLGENSAAKQKHELARVIRLEELDAQVDQLLSYHWWAEDYDARGKLRRTESDMYFAEVRPFEEIFRQGEQPPGGQQPPGQQPGQGQNAQDAQQLAQLQKEIINATWKLIRREIGDQPTQALASDAEQIHLSQSAAIEQAAALAGRLADEKSQEHIAAVQRHMQQAAEQLQTARESAAAAPLRPALDAEQAALQSLLKLRAREHEVVRQQQRGQQSQSRQSSARSQQQRQQLQQLDLREEQNRYETQRMAQEQQQESPADRENRQALSRLRELARRQHDLNERLKEMQSALEEAPTPEEQEEIRRQLKRLQDEQRQILQDTDELQSRLDQAPNQEQMNDQRQQLDETRDQVRRASDALDREQVTQAAASGTRAEQQFEDLREEFRRRAANRFSEEMQRMSGAARELDEREQQLAQQLQPPTDSGKQQSQAKSLREDDRREQVAEQLGQQRERLGELQNQMRDTIQEAEATEPLLSERLYDAARNLQDQSLDRTLQSAERSVRQGLTEDARQQEQAAGQGIRQLREGIDRAAEAVLGDETEALRRAREELENLSKELNQEVARNAQPQQAQQQPGQPQEGADVPSPMPGGADSPMPGGGQPSPMNTEQQGPRGQGQPSQSQGSRSQRGQQRLSDSAGQPQAGPGGGSEREFAPLTGERFGEWSDRLRDVEEMVDDPELRAEAARIRERARAMRADFKRHSQEPSWDLVQQQVAGPLVELRDRVADEVLRRTSKKALVPLDRDPVPPQYSEKTRRYYERLGSGR